MLSNTADDRQAVKEALQRGSNADAKKLESTQNLLTEYRRQYEQLDDTLRRLLDYFARDDPLPKSVAAEIRRLDQARDEICQEMSGLEDRISDLQGKCLSEAGLVASLKMLGQGRNLEEQKHLLQAVVAAVVVNPVDGREGRNLPDSGAGGLNIRTKRFLVNIRLKAKTPEHGGSGASQEECVNQTMVGSDLIQIGSPGRIRTTNQPVNSRLLYH